MSNIIDLPVITRLDINPEKIIDNSKDKLKSIVVIGWDMEDELYFASSIADGGEVLWLFELAKKELLRE